jgi:hypothetical protein
MVMFAAIRGSVALGLDLDDLEVVRDSAVAGAISLGVVAEVSAVVERGTLV